MHDPPELVAKEGVFQNRTIGSRLIQHPTNHHVSSNAVGERWTGVPREFGHRIFPAVI